MGILRKISKCVNSNSAQNGTKRGGICRIFSGRTRGFAVKIGSERKIESEFGCGETV